MVEWLYVLVECEMDMEIGGAFPAKRSTVCEMYTHAGDVAFTLYTLSRISSNTTCTYTVCVGVVA